MQISVDERPYLTLVRLSGRIGQQLTNPLAVAVRNRLLRLAPPRTAMAQLARYATWRP